MGTGGGLKVDGGVSSQLCHGRRRRRPLERRGYDGCWTAEVNHDPFLPLTLAAEHTEPSNSAPASLWRSRETR